MSHALLFDYTIVHREHLWACPDDHIWRGEPLAERGMLPWRQQLNRSSMWCPLQSPSTLLTLQLSLIFIWIWRTTSHLQDCSCSTVLSKQSSTWCPLAHCTHTLHTHTLHAHYTCTAHTLHAHYTHTTHTLTHTSTHTSTHPHTSTHLHTHTTGTLHAHMHITHAHMLNSSHTHTA